MHYLAQVATEVPPPATAWRMWPGWGGPALPAAAAAPDKAQIKKPTLSFLALALFELCPARSLGSDGRPLHY